VTKQQAQKNKYMKFKNPILLFWMLAILLTSCTKKTVHPTTPTFQKPGVFIVNEGNFTTGNASLTWYLPEKDTVSRDVFYIANKVPLGDVANFMTTYNDKGFIVVNNSGIVYVIDLYTGAFLGKISGLTSPREILILNKNSAWVSDLFNKYISVVDLNTYRITRTIDLHGRTSESMVQIGNKVFINNWSKLNQTPLNNMVMVLDAATGTIIDSITVTREPNSMVTDANNKLWVLCSGGYDNTGFPALYQINPNSDTIEKMLTFSDKTTNPFSLGINGAGNTLWFLNGDIYKININANQLPAIPWVTSGLHNFYSLGVRPDKESVYVSDALDYVRNGKVYIYSSTGELTGEIEAGIIPGFFCFFY